MEMHKLIPCLQKALELAFSEKVIVDVVFKILGICPGFEKAWLFSLAAKVD